MIKHFLPLSFVFGCFCLFSACQSKTTTVHTPNGTEEISTDELLQIMGQAYMYGYPLVLMDLTKGVSTNIDRPHPERPMAPVNQLGHFRTFPDHTLTAIVKPNVDTYYSIAWLDLKEEPQVLTMPATDRYYLLPFYDAYSNVFASPGSRTTGTDSLTLLVTGPDWEGEVPSGVTHIKAPTQMVWMLGRIQVNSPEDGATFVRDLQNGMQLVPLNAYGQADYKAPTGKMQATEERIIPVKKIQEIDFKAYFNKMAQLMTENPPAEADTAMLEKMAKIGLIPGQPFDISTDNLILKTKLNALPAYIHKQFEKRRAEPDTSLLSNGWMIVTEGIGEYGTDYMRRAYIDFIGLGANLAEDAVYPNCTMDINGRPLDGASKYQIHFEPHQIPPVNAFWSLTAYNADEFLVKNELNRFALGDRDDLLFNEDGSLDLFIQAEQPAAAKLQNWLPVPKAGPFSLTLRLYWPKAAILNGNWTPPAIIPVGD